MGARVAGPICSARVGDNWIDGGTVCRSRTDKPGPLDVADWGLLAWNNLLAGPKAKFDKDHVYSRAKEAAVKRDIDLRIIGDDYARSAEISLTNENYLKELIRVGSGGAETVSGSAKKIQFFIVRGGAEGLFTDPAMANVDASDVVFPGSTTGGETAPTFHFDNNDLLAVFDPKGKLIRAALLQRPLSITGAWTRKTANAIYDAWHGKEVSVYRNTNFDVPYVGFVVDDGMKKRGWVDMHKQEATNGCIFIVDDDTPALGTPELNTFEPKLINEVLASIGKKPQDVKGAIRLGVLRVVDIR